jgi:glutathione S-transferase
MFKNDIGAFDPGEGKKFLHALQGDAKYTRINKYINDVTSRPSFQKTFDEVSLVFLQLTVQYHDIPS